MPYLYLVLQKRECGKRINGEKKVQACGHTFGNLFFVCLKKTRFRRNKDEKRNESHQASEIEIRVSGHIDRIYWNPIRKSSLCVKKENSNGKYRSLFSLLIFTKDSAAAVERSFKKYISNGNCVCRVKWQ